MTLTTPKMMTKTTRATISNSGGGGLPRHDGDGNMVNLYWPVCLLPRVGSDADKEITPKWAIKQPFSPLFTNSP